VNFSVGDIAEQIMAQDAVVGKGAPQAPSFAPDESVYSPNVTQQAPDISEVQVPNDFVTSIVEGKAPVVPAPETIEEPVVQPVSEVTELKSLVEEIKSLLLEVKQTLSEMTSVGMGMGAPANTGEKKKEDEEDDLQKILKAIKKKRQTKA
jgi:hypothetical protein